jgi:hypothetical protein
VTNIVRSSRTGAGITDNARRAEKNQPRILIGNDARLMDLLQRFRPATYWAVLAKRIEKMGAKGK